VFGLVVVEHLRKVAHVEGLAADLTNLEVFALVGRLAAHAFTLDAFAWFVGVHRGSGGVGRAGRNTSHSGGFVMSAVWTAVTRSP
jgi:hypothetical protein